jgi:hypothetical protein
MEATAWLGHWYREVAQNYAKARNCYKKVLAADPGNTVIGARRAKTEPQALPTCLRCAAPRCQRRHWQAVGAARGFKLLVPGDRPAPAVGPR